jgi:putative ABC transport system permease protein
MRVCSRIKAAVLNLLHREQVETELDAEIRGYVDAVTDEKIAAGMSSFEARRRALVEIGGVEQVKQAVRQRRAGIGVEILWQDVRYGLRQLRRNPGFTAAAVLTVALGIGLNTAVFSLVSAVLLRPLPYPHPENIVEFMRTQPGSDDSTVASPAWFNVWRQQTQIFQDVSAFRFSLFGLTGSAEPEPMSYGQVSDNFFHLYGAPLAMGRTFSEAEELPGGGHVVVLSNDLWRQRFHGDLQIVGKTISLSGQPYDVVGVLGFSFDVPAISAGWGEERLPDVWIPLQLDPNSRDYNGYFNVAARLRSGVALLAANAELQAVAEEYRRLNPGDVEMGPKYGFGVQPIREFLDRGERSTLFPLFGAVGFVLLIACANVANLILARGAGRKHEFAIRAAVGAGRRRIIRQLLAESLVLAVAGGTLGLVLGISGIHAVLRIGHTNNSRLGEHGSAVTMDWRVLLFTLLASLSTAVLFGLFPALQSSRVDLSENLKEGGGRFGTGFRQSRGRSLLVVSEVALALILLVGAGLLMRTFVALHSVDSGLDSRNVLTMQMVLSGARFQNTTGLSETVRTSLQRINALPGVVATGFTCCLPLAGQLQGSINVVGRPSNEMSLTVVSTISPDYFRVFRIPLMRGRTFTDRDDAGTTPVVVINETLARRFWPKGEVEGDPLSGQIRVLDTPDLPPWQIVGIVGDVRAFGLDGDPPAIMYIPAPQTPEDLNIYLVRNPVFWIVRTRVNPYLISLSMQSVLRQVTDGLPVLSVRSMDEIVRQSAGRQNFSLVLMTIFAGSAMLLAAIGIYGVIAYSAEERAHEIGIRMAMGAQRGDVLRLVVGHGIVLALTGVGIGVAGALCLTRFLSNLLYGVKPTDAFTFGVVSFTLISVAFLACSIPARRATKVDPMTALRCE